jgi:hypothetical protein
MYRFLHGNGLMKWVTQVRLSIAINKCFECSVFRGSVFGKDPFHFMVLLFLF